jgi:hypothetical protein
MLLLRSRIQSELSAARETVADLERRSRSEWERGYSRGYVKGLARAAELIRDFIS